MNFYLFLGKLLLKIEPSEIPSFFYNFFQFRGVGERSVFPPAGATANITGKVTKIILKMMWKRDILRIIYVLKSFSRKSSYFILLTLLLIPKEIAQSLYLFKYVHCLKQTFWIKPKLLSLDSFKIWTNHLSKSTLT